MKTKFKLSIWTVIVSYFITMCTASFLPGVNYGPQNIGYGYPMSFLIINKEMTLSPDNILISKIGFDVLSFSINIIITIIILNVIVYIYKLIKQKASVQGSNLKKSSEQRTDYTDKKSSI